jgi:hypothetical protein
MPAPASPAALPTVGNSGISADHPSGRVVVAVVEVAPKVHQWLFDIDNGKG